MSRVKIELNKTGLDKTEQKQKIMTEIMWHFKHNSKYNPTIYTHKPSKHSADPAEWQH